MWESIENSVAWPDHSSNLRVAAKQLGQGAFVSLRREAVCKSIEQPFEIVILSSCDGLTERPAVAMAFTDPSGSSRQAMKHTLLSWELLQARSEDVAAFLKPQLFPHALVGKQAD